MNPYQVVKDFEKALCDYTGSRYAVTTTSCTMALLLACAYWKDRKKSATVCIPKRTYVGVPQSIIHAGFRVEFRDEDWSGCYQISPLRVWDYARRLTSGMYREGQMQCVSFHWSKTLGIGQGGAILHDNDYADEWLRRARFDGRTEGSNEPPTSLGYHAYMMPRDAAEGLSRLSLLPEKNDDIPWDDYLDLSQIEIFRADSY